MTETKGSNRQETTPWDRSGRSLRAQLFSKDWPLDREISDIAATFPSHRFLANASGQYSYVYLSQFVKAMSEKHFRRPFGDLQVLDWGCGKGHMSKLIRDLGPKQLESCDLVSGGPDSAFGQDIPIIRTFKIPVTRLEHESDLPYDSATFDILLSVGVLEHVANEQASMAEISRVLKTGGLFFCFFLPARFSWTQQLYRWLGGGYHERLYTDRDVAALLRPVSLSLLDVWYRQLLPKNSVRYPNFRAFERLDLLITERTPLRYLATNIEFVSVKTASNATMSKSPEYVQYSGDFIR